MNTKDKIIWNNIEQLLDEKGWSLADLSRKSNTRPQTINSLKSGDRGIGPNLMKRLATAFGAFLLSLKNNSK